MSKVVTTNVIPDDASNDLLTIGAASDAVAVNDSLNVDTLQDMGGNTIFVSDGSGTITSKNSGFPGSLQLLSTQTASDDASISFTSGIDSTYDVYVFKFMSIKAASSDPDFGFQGNAVGEADFNEVITSTVFRAYHDESDSTANLSYATGQDQAQGTAYQCIARNVGSGSDNSASGELYFFGPSSTTYVKHFYSRGSGAADYEMDTYTGGYFNTTGAIDQISFKMSSGNFDGTIKMYGISKS